MQPRSSRGKWWSRATAAGVVTVSAVMTLAVVLAPWAWPADMIVILAGPAWTTLGLLLGAITMGVGARVRSVPLLASGPMAWASAGLLMAIGWWGRQLTPIPAWSDEPGLVRVAQVNMNARGSEVEAQALQVIAECGADVVVMTEFPTIIWSMLREESELSRAYPNFSYREWVPGKVPGCVVLSKWPLERIEMVPGDEREQVFLGRVESPAGQFTIAQIVPQSPRTWNRWERGNQIVEGAVEVLREQSATGPVVLGCDLNASAFGMRGRVLRRAGFAPASAAWALTGTWRSGLPRVMKVGLDDVWTGRGAEIEAWRTIAVPGSDHLMVEAWVRLAR